MNNPNVEKVIEAADYFFRDSNGNTALHHAVAKNDIKTVQQLLKNSEINQTLLDAENNSNKNALDIAAAKGYSPMVDILIQHDITRKIKESSTHATALHLALQREGENAHKSIDDIKTIAESLLKAYPYNQEFLLSNVKPINDNLLLDAVNLRSETLVQLLLDQGANPNTYCPEGTYPIIAATQHNDLGIVNLLLDYDINQLYRCDLSGNTAAHIAVKNRYTYILKSLLQKDSKNSLCALKNNDGNNLLHLAVEQNRLSIVQLLVNANRGKDLLEQKSKDRRTALEIAQKAGHAKIAHYLVQQGADDRTRISKLSERIFLPIKRAVEPIKQLVQKLVSETPQEAPPSYSPGNYEEPIGKLVNDELPPYSLGDYGAEDMESGDNTEHPLGRR